MLKQKFIMITVLSFIAACVLFMAQAAIQTSTVRKSISIELEHDVQSILTLFDYINTRVHRNQMDYDRARSIAIDIVKSNSTPDKQFWMHDLSGVIITHPDPSVVGMNVKNLIHPVRTETHNIIQEQVDYGADINQVLPFLPLDVVEHPITVPMPNTKLALIKPYYQFSVSVGVGIEKSTVYRSLAADLGIIGAIDFVVWIGFTAALWMFVYPMIKGHVNMNIYLSSLINDDYSFDVEQCSLKDEVGQSMREVRRIRDYLRKEQFFSQIHHVDSEHGDHL